MSINLLDLLWEDILIPNVASRLSIKDLYNLSLCSTKAQSFANLALKSVQKLIFDFKGSEGEYLLKYLSENCTNLTEFVYTSTMNKNLITLLKRNKNLIKLNIGAVSVDPHFTRSNKDELVEAIKLKKNLEAFRFIPGFPINQQKLIDIFQNLTNLKEIGGSKYFKDEVILSITKNCRKIERLDLSYIDGHITDNSIQYLIDDCPTLKWLCVNFLSRDLFIKLNERGVKTMLVHPSYAFYDSDDDEFFCTT